MRKHIVILGILSLAAWASAQTPLYKQPDTTNTNKLSACEVSQGFYMLMDGSRSAPTGLAQNFRGAGTTATGTTLSATWKDTVFSDSLNGPGTRAVFKTGQSAVDLSSRVFYRNFDVRISFRNTDNSGFFYRGIGNPNPPWNTAIEVGIDNKTTAVPREQTGSVFDIFPPQPLQAVTQFTYASSKWNELRVIAIGDSVQHWVNGIKVVDYKMFSTAFFSGVGTVAGVTTGYNTSKWNSGKEVAFAVKGSVAGGPTLNGILGVQGAHPGNMFIRNFRIDTIPTWVENNANYPDTVSSCGVVGVASKGKPANVGAFRINYSANKLVVSIPTGSLREAMLIDAFGRVQMKARISGQRAEFDKYPGNGVYFLRYRDMTGIQNARLSLVGVR